MYFDAFFYREERAVLTIKFKTDIDFMARLMILKNKMPTEFANYLWDKYRLSYIYLQKDFKSDEIDNNIVKELQQQKFFKQLCEGANKNLDRFVLFKEKVSEKTKPHHKKEAL